MALSKRKLSPWFLLALLLLLAYVSFDIARVFLNYILSGLFIAYVTYPLYERVLPIIRFRPVAALTMVFLVAGLILAPLVYLFVQLVDELRLILLTLDVGLLGERLGGVLGEGDGEPGFLDILTPGLNALLSSFASDLLRIVAEGFIGLFVMLYILYYAYLDGPRLVETVRDIIPLQDAHKDLLFDEVGNVVKAVIYGHVLTALIQAGFAAIGFLLFGVPNVVFWSAISFVLALLPIVGPPLVWVPWGVYLILQGDTFAGVGLLIYSAIMVSSLDNIIRPKLIGDRAHIHPAVVLIGVLGGVVVFGFSGLILGPLVLSIFVSILQVYRREFAGRGEDEPLLV